MKKLCLILAVIMTVALLLSISLSLMGRVSLGPKVAIVEIEGPILSSESWLKELKEYEKDSSIKAIVLRINSPGGGVAPSQELYEKVRSIRKDKPIVASMGSVAASGGYYIASAATKIYANPGTITGSIGVIMEIPNIEELLDKVGIKTEVIKSGKHKDIASVFRSLSKEDRQILQNVLRDVHEQFIRAVSEGRGIPVEKVREIADGRIFTGLQAKSLGLVDELGGLEMAVKEAARLGGIEGEPQVVRKKKKFSLLDLLTGKVSVYVKELFSPFNLKYSVQ